MTDRASAGRAHWWRWGPRGPRGGCISWYPSRYVGLPSIPTNSPNLSLCRSTSRS